MLSSTSSVSAGAAKAIVAFGPASTKKWSMEDVKPRPIKNDEVLVRIIASGICVADVHFGSIVVDEAAGQTGNSFPMVLGHEGEPQSLDSLFEVCAPHLWKGVRLVHYPLMKTICSIRIWVRGRGRHGCPHGQAR